MTKVWQCCKPTQCSGTGKAITLAVEKTAEAGYQAHHLVERGIFMMPIAVVIALVMKTARDIGLKSGSIMPT
jgi:hypothetical protein